MQLRSLTGGGQHGSAPRGATWGAPGARRPRRATTSCSIRLPSCPGIPIAALAGLPHLRVRIVAASTPRQRAIRDLLPPLVRVGHQSRAGARRPRPSAGPVPRPPTAPSPPPRLVGGFRPRAAVLPAGLHPRHPCSAAPGPPAWRPTARTAWHAHHGGVHRPLARPRHHARHPRPRGGATSSSGRTTPSRSTGRTATASTTRSPSVSRRRTPSRRSTAGATATSAIASTAGSGRGRRATSS